MNVNAKFSWSYLHLPYYPKNPKNISAVKQGKGKKMQVTERPKDVISLWGQEEKLYQLGCVYRTPAYKVNSFK